MLNAAFTPCLRIVSVSVAVRVNLTIGFVSATLDMAGRGMGY